ncbi:hypothetical protein QAD02_020726 [Eretmocerus hayati]|uniref:Uncharacterized protein n=1 Tax=Eretmocerus hayati TaxID=131215 RepID=A0ACC2PP87_9HYME|nr:hypothetical protein QAD02_020726 [Eretmocerus hayati]
MTPLESQRSMFIDLLMEENWTERDQKSFIIELAKAKMKEEESPSYQIYLAKYLFMQKKKRFTDDIIMSMVFRYADNKDFEQSNNMEWLHESPFEVDLEKSKDYKCGSCPDEEFYAVGNLSQIVDLISENFIDRIQFVHLREKEQKDS